MTDYDVIVVGAGIFGSCAAYHSQKLGLKTLLLEQFALGHKNGSSHGMSRIIRYAHMEDEYVPLVRDAYRQIEELEKKRGEKLWKKTGLLWAAPVDYVDKMASILKKQGCDHEVIRGSQVSSRFKQFTFDDSLSGLIDPMGGVLYADKWLKAFQEEFLELGGRIRDNVEVYKYTDSSNGVKLATSVGTYTTKKVIFTVGSWLGKLLPETKLKIRPESLAVCYWKQKSAYPADIVSDENFPVFISSEMNDNMSVYGMPAPDYPGTIKCKKINEKRFLRDGQKPASKYMYIKFCHHHGNEIPHGGDHPKVESDLNDPRVQAPMEFIKRHLPVIEPTPYKIDRCKYTISEDDHYVIDHLPGSRNVIIGGCGCGSGFKVGPAIGRTLAEFASGRKSTIDVSFFSFDRFKKSSL